ncbi:MAG: hypothetical protein ABL857_06260, partial [Rickettsiales bacterium]
IGWSIENYTSCCSYVLTTYLKLYKAGKFYTVAPVSGVVWKWNFLPKIDLISIEYGFPHGMEKPNIGEYNIKTGKEIKHIQDGK